MKLYKLILNFVGLFLLTSCVVNPPVEPSIEPSIIEPTAPEIDETKLVGVVVNELLPVVNIDCEEEIQSNFEYKKVVGGVAITSYLGNLECFSIPQYFKVDNEEHLVVQIDKSAFEANKTIKQISLPEGLKEIKESAFSKCANLNSIKLPSSLEKIEKYAFSDLENLKEINIPLSVKEIQDGVFLGSSTLAFVYVEAEKAGDLWEDRWNSCFYDVHIRVRYGVKGIVKHNEMDFLLANESLLLSYKGEGVENLVIPSKIIYQGESFIISTISSNAFEGNNKIKNVTLSYGIQKIEGTAFYNSSIEYISFSETINHIGSSTFENCTHLKEIAIPERVLYIGYSVFKNCTSLIDVQLHNKLTIIDLDAFSGCRSLNHIVIPRSVFRTTKAFLNCDNLTIYCEAEDQPDTWDENWNYHNRPVYWKNQWTYNNGVPVIL